MIRFACPTCAAGMTADDEKAGKTGRCPECQARFVIPGGAEPALARPSRRPRDDEDEDDEDDSDRRPRRRSRRRDEDDEPEECKKVTAGVLALLLGGWGVHKFYLGYTTAGVIQLVLTLVTCGLAAVVPLVEGIIYLTRSDREFVRKYQRRRREWF